MILVRNDGLQRGATGGDNVLVYNDSVNHSSNASTAADDDGCLAKMDRVTWSLWFWVMINSTVPHGRISHGDWAIRKEMIKRAAEAEARQLKIEKEMEVQRLAEAAKREEERYDAP